jgi:AraC family transcriptional regulator, transcriptional activator of pobA
MRPSQINMKSSLIGMKPSLKIFVESAITNSFSVEQLEGRVVDTELPNRLSYHRILLVEQGSGTLIIDDHRFEVRSHQVFLLAKGQLFFFEHPSVITGYTISFGDCFWEKAPASASNCKAVLFNDATANQCLTLNDQELLEFGNLFQTLLSEYNTPSYPNQVDAMAAYLKIIMIKLANVPLLEHSAVDSQDYILYRKFMELLSARFREHHEVSDYAALLGITARRLSDLCKRCSNKNAKEIINGQIIAEAKRGLQFSALSIKEIAYQLSFSTPEQFSAFFKKNTSYSPANFRNYFVNIGVM